LDTHRVARESPRSLLKDRYGVKREGGRIKKEKIKEGRVKRKETSRN